MLYNANIYIDMCVVKFGLSFESCLIIFILYGGVIHGENEPL